MRGFFAALRMTKLESRLLGERVERVEVAWVEVERERQ